MKMKKLSRRILCLSLAVTTAFSFTGCGKKNQDDDILNQASKASKEYVFAQNTLDISDKATDINRIAYVGDKVYASTYGSGQEVYIFSFNSDGSDINTIKIPLKDDENLSYISYDADGNIYGIEYIYHWNDYEDIDDDHDEASDESSDESSDASSGDSSDSNDINDDGQMHIFASEDASVEGGNGDETAGASDSGAEETSEEIEGEIDTDPEAPGIDGNYNYEGSDEEIYFVKYDNTGKLLEKIDLNKECGEGGTITVNSLVVTDEGKALFSVENGIISYTKDKGFKKILDSTSNSRRYNYYQLYKGFKNQIFVSYYGDNHICLCTFDPDSGVMGEPSSTINTYQEYSFFGGNGYDLYVSDNVGIYGFDLASDSLTKLLDYTDSDIEITGSISSCVAISDGEFVASLQDADYNNYLARLLKVPPEEVKEKQIITIGGYNIDYEVRKLAFAFNRENSDYKIKFVDYSAYDTEGNYGAGAERLNMDIVSGNTPDIIIIGEDMPVDSYINKGLFCDLLQFLNNDPDISENDFLINVFDAFKTGEKLYQLVPSFYISTMIVKKKYTGGKDVLSFEDCEDLMKQKGVEKQNAFGLITRNNFLEQGIRFSGDTYIDWENRKCNFDSESFIHFLEFSNGLVVEYPDNMWEDYKDTLYRTDDALFSITSISSISDFKYYKQGLFGTDISCVGYPNDMGINNSVIYPSKRLAISAQSKNKDSAWEFLKKFLTEEYQDEVYYFPVRKTSFDKKAMETTQKPYYMDDDKKVEYDESYFIGGQDIKAVPFTQEEVLEYTNFVKSLKLVSNYNVNVNNIIFEEASAYFSGQKSAEEVADIIQSRLSIYVNENS